MGGNSAPVDGPHRSPSELLPPPFGAASGEQPLIALPRGTFERLASAAGVAPDEFLSRAHSVQLLGAAREQDIGIGGEEDELLVLATSLYRLRRRRETLFPEGIFCEPGWDLLLDLFIAQRSGRAVSVTSACIAAMAPATTALRWLKHLETNRLVSRESDPADRRRVYVRLTSEGSGRMESLLCDARRLLALCA